jgi:hypothetical protein
MHTQDHQNRNRSRLESQQLSYTRFRLCCTGFGVSVGRPAIAADDLINGCVSVTLSDSHDEINGRSTGTTWKAFPVNTIGVDARAWVVIVM